MKQIILSTLIINFLICLIIGIGSVIAGENPGWMLYVCMMAFGSLLIPILIASILYFFLLKKRFDRDPSISEFFLQVLLTFLIIQTGLWVWAIIDVILYWTFSGLSFSHIVDDYENEFLQFLPLTIIIAAAFPILNRLFSKRRINSEKQNTV